MRRFIAGVCCVIVGIQVLVGVPLAVCIAFLMHFGSDLLGPTSVEFRIASNAQQPVVTPPVDEPSAQANQADAILEAREERGSLFAGTLLGESVSPADEQREFVAAFRQVVKDGRDDAVAVQPVSEAHSCRGAADHIAAAVHAPVNMLPGPDAAELAVIPQSDSLRTSADRFAIEHLYLIAEQDEQAGLFERSDQWRGLARAIRCPPDPAANGSSAADDWCARAAEVQ
jgi:hypothetical protein